MKGFKDMEVRELEFHDFFPKTKVFKGFRTETTIIAHENLVSHVQVNKIDDPLFR